MTPEDRNIIDVTPEVDPEPAEGSSGSGPARGLFVITLIMLAGMGAALFYAWQHWQGAREELASLNQRAAEARQAQQTLIETIESTRATLASQQQEIEQHGNVLDQQSERIAGQEQEVAASQHRMRAERRDLAAARAEIDRRLAAAERRIEGEPRRWLVAEATSLLRTAKNRLELAGDRDGALEAMRRADRLLQRSGEQWQPVRELLAGETTQLEAFTPVEVHGIARRLLNLKQQTRSLPLKTAVLPPPPAAAADGGAGEPPVESVAADNRWEHAADRSLRALRGLVAVRRTTPGQLPVTTGPYEAWLRQTLRVDLDNARIGALGKNAALYLASVDAATGLLTDFFAAGAERDAALGELKELSAVSLEQVPPRTGAALDALESARSGRPPS
jgi:uroporphyrin-3 C-methyltransferase